MSMITHVTLGYDDLEKAREFYDDILAPLGYKRVMEMDSASVYGEEGGSAQFVVLTPRDGNPATAANGFTMGFVAGNRAAVDEFHKRALARGAQDEGEPGPRPISPTAYGAYIRDVGGHKVCAFTFSEE